jgi:hypothetical protein
MTLRQRARKYMKMLEDVIWQLVRAKVRARAFEIADDLGLREGPGTGHGSTYHVMLRMAKSGRLKKSGPYFSIP